MRNFLILLALSTVCSADDADALARQIQSLGKGDLAQLAGPDGKPSAAISDFVRAQLSEANRRDREAWAKIRTKQEWEAYRQPRIDALRRSLGTWPEAPKSIAQHVTRTIEGRDYRIDNIVYESRPGVWVTGNLYYPSRRVEKSPVILIVHSHHQPKHEGEIQDMGITWARLGCHVLCIDQLGHGERRQHSFHSSKDYPKEFRVGRQDYYSRYNLNLQLSLIGDSLMGWMAWDLMRGLDVALGRPGADKDRVILLGSVAGGGDVAGVTAALDPRITCVAPFNFGGPQPETRYPLPDNAEETFNYAGSGSWESTRNLRQSAADGFLHWSIVASIAPRKLIHAHEFSWDRERDPVWKRYQKVWGFYDAVDGVSHTQGTGVIHGNDPNASHCNNIGPVHRKGIYTALNKWFGIAIPEKDSRERRPSSDLKCWTPELERELKPRPLHEVLDSMAKKQLPTADSIDRKKFAEAFGITGAELPRPVSISRTALVADVDAFLETFRGEATPYRVVVLRPKNDGAVPVVLCLSQEGAARTLSERSVAVASLLKAGVGVVLLDWEGSAAYRIGDTRGRGSSGASITSSTLMIGRPLPALRANNVQTVMNLFRTGWGRFDRERIAIWAESLAPPVANDSPVAVPQDLTQPPHAEPMAGVLASLHEPKAIVIRGGLLSYRSVFRSSSVLVPHDAMPIDLFRRGDLPELWSRHPSSMLLEGLVDGVNRRVKGKMLETELNPLRSPGNRAMRVVREEYSTDAELAKWLIDRLAK